jgi:hypothetical protein
MVIRDGGVFYQFRNYHVFKDDCIMDLILLQEIRNAHYMTDVYTSANPVIFFQVSEVLIVIVYRWSVAPAALLAAGAKTNGF